MFSLISLYFAYRRNAPVPARPAPSRVPVLAVNDREALPSARAA